MVEVFELLASHEVIRQLAEFAKIVPDEITFGFTNNDIMSILVC